MVHDEKPSDIWWHDTDTLVLRIFDKFYSRIEFGQKWEGLDREVQEIAPQLKAKLDEALIHYQYLLMSTRVITISELIVVEFWHLEVLTLLGLVLNLWKKQKDLSEVEAEMVFNEAKKVLAQLRENIRDHYLFDRQIEKRCPQ